MAKTFDQFREELAESVEPSNFKPKKDEDKEVLDYEPRAPGEKEMADDSTTDKIGKHPVAPESQFKGGTKKGGDHKGGKKHAPGEMTPPMQGSSKLKEDIDLGELKKQLTSRSYNKLIEEAKSNPKFKVTSSKIIGEDEDLLPFLHKHKVGR